MNKSQTVPDILNALRTHNDYHHLNDYYIKKQVGVKYHVDNVKKEHLLQALNDINNTLPLVDNNDTNTTLPLDVFNDILYQSDIDTIMALCSSNKALTKTCHRRSFWETIFERDGLMIVDHPKTLDDYDIMYHNMVEAKTETKGIMNVIHHYDIKKIHISINKLTISVDGVKRNMVNEIFDYKGRGPSIDIEVDIGSTIRLYLVQKLDKMSIPKIPLQRFGSMLQKLLYYYPHLRIHTTIISADHPHGFAFELRKSYLLKYASDAPYKKLSKQDKESRKHFHSQVLTIFGI